MFNARFIFALLILAGAALAACSGNFGAGTSSPGGLLPSGPLSGVAATATQTPSSANAIVTYGDSSQFQPLPEVAGYGGAIAFEVPSPRPSGFAAVPIGVTLSISPPADTPDLNLATAGKNGTKRARRARQLVYISLLATRDVTLAAYPHVAVDVPRNIVTTYRQDEINLGLFDVAEKDKTFRLAVADHDTASPPPPPNPAHTAPPAPTPIPVSAASAGASAAASGVPAGFPSGVLTPAPGTSGVVVPGGSPAPLTSPTLPPQRILFAATAHSLKLPANTSVVFAVYALPIATPSPAPSGSAAATAGASPGPAGSAATVGSPGPAASPGAATTGVPPATTAPASTAPASGPAGT